MVTKKFVVIAVLLVSQGKNKNLIRVTQTIRVLENILLNLKSSKRPTPTKTIMLIALMFTALIRKPFYVPYLLLIQLLFNFILRSIMGIHKPRHSLVCRLLFGASESWSSHIPSEVAAPRYMATIRAELCQCAEFARC